MPGTSANRDDYRSHGPSPTSWAITATGVAAVIGYLLGEQPWVVPDWGRWWMPVLGIEIVVYTLTLFLPPASRLSPISGLLRVFVGMAMRFVVVVINAAMRLHVGDTTFLEGVGVYWAGHWVAAVGEIVVVGVAVYWFRYLSVERIRQAMIERREVAPMTSPLSGLSREELVDELLSSEPEPEAAPVSHDQLHPPTGVTPPEERVAEAATTPPDVWSAPVGEEEIVPPPAPVVETEPQASSEVSVGPIRVPAQIVLEALPPGVLAQPVDALAPELASTDVLIPWEEIEPKLKTGEVRVAAMTILSQLPHAILSGPATRFADELPDGVVLPLAEIVMRIPPEVFAPPDDQEADVQVPPGPPIFTDPAPPAPGTAPVRSIPPEPTPVWVPTPSPPPVPARPSPPIASVAPVEAQAGTGEERFPEAKESAEVQAITDAQPLAAAEPALAEEADEAAVAEEATPTGDTELEEALSTPEPQPVEEVVATEPLGEAVVTEEDVPEEKPQVGQPSPPLEKIAPAESPVSAHLEPDTEKAILDTLKGVGTHSLEVIARDGLVVVCADGAGSAEGAYELTARAVALANAADAELESALFIPSEGATFIGHAAGSPGVYLTVTSHTGSAGQVSVAARKAVALLSDEQAAGTRLASSTPPATEDAYLGAIAADADPSAVGGFRTETGMGVLVFGFEPRAAAAVAAAAGALWEAGKAAAHGRLEKALITVPNLAIGLTFAGEAEALVLAGFGPGLNPGLVAAALGKLARACEQVAREGA